MTSKPKGLIKEWIYELLLVFSACLILMASTLIYYIYEDYFTGDDGRLVAPLSAPAPVVTRQTESTSHSEYDDTNVGEFE